MATQSGAQCKPKPSLKQVNDGYFLFYYNIHLGLSSSGGIGLDWSGLDWRGVGGETKSKKTDLSFEMLRWDEIWNLLRLDSFFLGTSKVVFLNFSPFIKCRSPSFFIEEQKWFMARKRTYMLTFFKHLYWIRGTSATHTHEIISTLWNSYLY